MIVDVIIVNFSHFSYVVLTKTIYVSHNIKFSINQNVYFYSGKIR